MARLCSLATCWLSALQWCCWPPEQQCMSPWRSTSATLRREHKTQSSHNTQCQISRNSSSDPHSVAQTHIRKLCSKRMQGVTVLRVRSRLLNNLTYKKNLHNLVTNTFPFRCFNELRYYTNLSSISQTWFMGLHHLLQTATWVFLFSHRHTEKRQKSWVTPHF